MNIAFVNNRNQLGGAETVMHQLHRGCLARGHQSEIYLGEYSEGNLPKHVHPLFPRTLQKLYHSRLHRWTSRFINPATYVNEAFGNLGSRGHDIVHLHNFHGIYASMDSLAKLARSVPLVWTFHRFWGVTGGCDHPGECRRYLESCGACPRVNEWPIGGIDNTAAQLQEKRRLLATAPLTIVAPSHHLAKVVRESPIGANWRVEVIPNGVDPAEFQPLDPERQKGRAEFGLSLKKKVVVAVNRSFSEPLKGGDILAAAITQLDFSRAQVVLVGGDTAPLLARLPAHADVVTLGYVRDRRRLAALLGASDLFLYASPRENFPCATLEAMSAGCCVVSTPTDGVLEQIRDGVEGLFAPDFSGNGLAQAANRMLQQPEALRKFGEAARQRLMSDFSEDTMVSHHLRLFQETIDSFRHATR